MGLKKKKNIIVLTVCMAVCFILYQLYFFLTITSETGNGNRIIPVFDTNIVEVIPLRSEADKFINNNGVIKGVFHQHVTKYRPDSENNFKCLNSEQYIPFSKVNDDYCDCEDETDEPSTSACPKSVFYCDFQYRKKPMSVNKVSSGKVNDGICDCCDGSDEWLRAPNLKLLTQSNSKFYRYFSNKCLNVC